MRGFSAWILTTYRKLRFVVIVLVILSLILWYFNSVLFYDTIDGATGLVMATGNMVSDFVSGF